MKKPWEMCGRRVDSYKFDKVLLIGGTVLAIIAVILQLISYDPDIILLPATFAITFWALLACIIGVKLREGYTIEEDGICFRYRFQQHKLRFEDINCIIISNANMRQMTTRGLWVTIIGGEQNAILEYCMNGNKTQVLSGLNIEYKLGAAIGFYSMGNVWEMFKAGSATIKNYDFVWSDRIIYKLFEGYKGDYYIAASVFSHSQKELEDLFKRYSVSSERIHIIDDSTNGVFVWR